MSVRIVLGKSGSGKTTLTRSLIGEMRRVVIIDPMDQFPDAPALTVSGLHHEIATLPLRQDYRARLIITGVPAFDYVARLVLWRGDLTLLVDEVDIFASSPMLREIVMRGRHARVNLIATSRRPAEVPRDLTSQASELYSFRQAEPRDLDYLRKYFGSSVTDQLPTLSEFSYLRYRDGGNYAIYPPESIEKTS